MKCTKVLSQLLVSVMVFALTVSLPLASSAADKELVTLEILSLPSNYSGVIEGWYGKFLEEELNIKLDLLPSGDQGEQKLQAFMASGELPDIVVFKDYKQVQDAQRANLIVPFDDYKDLLPNVYKYAATALQYIADNVTTDGKAYVLPNNIGPAGPITDFNWTPMVRWDLYKQLGYPEVKTLEDIIPLLKKMQEIEPVNEDGQKVYGLSMWSDWDAVSSLMAASYCNLIGADSDQIVTSAPFAEIDYRTNVMTSILDEGSTYRRMLRFMYELNQQGLMDPDSLTQRFNTATEKVEAGRILFGAWPWFLGSYNKPQNTYADPFKGFACLPFEEYIPLSLGDNKVGLLWAWGISSTGKHIDRCMEYLNFICDPEILWILRNGPQGIMWDTDNEGKPYITQLGYDEILTNPDYVFPDGGKLSDGEGLINSLPLTNQFIVEKYGEPMNCTLWSTYQEPPVSNVTKDWREFTGYKNPVERQKDLGMTIVKPLAVDFLAPLSDDMQMVMQRVGDVVKTDSWLVMFAKDDTEFQQLLDEMVAKAKGLGLDDIMAFNQENWAAALVLASKYK